MKLTVVLRRLEQAAEPDAPAPHSATVAQRASLVTERLSTQESARRAWGHVPLLKLSVLFGIH